MSDTAIEVLQTEVRNLRMALDRAEQLRKGAERCRDEYQAEGARLATEVKSLSDILRQCRSLLDGLPPTPRGKESLVTSCRNAG